MFARLDKSNELAITREQWENRDIIERYFSEVPIIDEERLREQFEELVEAKQAEGFPVMLIYDGEGIVSAKHNNPNVPSEMEFEGSIDKNRLRILLAPDYYIQRGQEWLARRNINTEVLPIEILEVI